MVKRIDRISFVVFAVIAGLFGIFYSVGDFGKAFSQQCGLLQLAGAIILFLRIITNEDEIPVFCSGLVLAIALCQPVAIHNWAWWEVSIFSIDWPVWVALHTAFAVWGIVLAVKTLLPQREKSI